MATNGTTPYPARCTVDQLAEARAELELERQISEIVGKPALEAWAVASLLNDYISAADAGGQDGFSPTQREMLLGAVQILERLTRMTYDGTGQVELGKGGA